jgi:hypothetical protein
VRRLCHDSFGSRPERADPFQKCWFVVHTVVCCWLLKLDQPAAAFGSSYSIAAAHKARSSQAG